MANTHSCPQGTTLPPATSRWIRILTVFISLPALICRFSPVLSEQFSRVRLSKRKIRILVGIRERVRLSKWRMRILVGTMYVGKTFQKANTHSCRGWTQIRPSQRTRMDITILLGKDMNGHNHYRRGTERNRNKRNLAFNRFSLSMNPSGT